MTKISLWVTIAFLLGFGGLSAQAQEYGAFVGVHQTTANTDYASTSVNGIFNWKAGLNAMFEFTPQIRFRTGATYTQRHFQTTTDVGGNQTKIKYKYDYIDVPANFQYNFNEMFGAFAGLVVGININDDVSGASSGPSVNGLIPLADVGLNFYTDPIGFDLYYERGIGKFADHLSDFSTFGGNLIVWF